MRALVTGASGFIGGVLCAQLLERGHEVSALVRRPGSEPPGTVGLVAELDDGPALNAALVSARPDCVFHLAAEIASQRSERKLREVNVAGTQRLLDACLALAGSAGENAVAAAVRSARSSNAKIKRELGWQPRFPIAREGVADATARLSSR
jgi:nucleoside-diphosphate-sugar epimerase